VGQEGLRQRLTAILAADVAGYTRLMAADADATVRALDAARAVFRREIEAHGGRVVDMVGDAVLALFESAGGALAAALAAQKALEAAGSALAEERRLRVRIGVHLGDVIEKADGSIYGHGVNLAARLEARAVPGGICMSQPLYESVKDKLPVHAHFGGRQRFKNIDEAVAVWHIVPEGTPPHYALQAAPNNLPLQLTSFIGRDGELAEVARLLEESRLLTLLGLGGIGKSRLSLELARQVAGEFEDGVWLVELATLRDSQLVPQAVASALGVKEAAGRPVGEALVQHVRDRQTLLILDNCEHLLHGCAELTRQLLQAGPQCKVLATSREPLRLAGETTYPVPALPEAEAVRLFVDRAAKAKPGFHVNGDAHALSTVCRRLDGIPLAIELAAARVRTLSVSTIASRLDDRFKLLTRGDQTALPRQQTLRALIDWSYELLTVEERAVLQRLAVFAGGWTLEAAEAVACAEPVESGTVLDLLSQLVEKSLVTLDAKAERYDLLDTVHQYAQERLDEAGAAAGARERHLRYYVALAEKARPQLTGPQQGQWLALLDRERENLLTAHAWCDHVPSGAELGLELVYLLRPYWLNRGLLGLGQRLTTQALARNGADARNFARCRALFVAGQFSNFMGAYPQAQRYLEESLGIAREIGDRRRMVAALQPLGSSLLGQGQLETARRYLEEALAAAKELDEPREVAAASNQLAQLLRVAGELDRAEALYQRVVTLAEQVGDRETVGLGLLNLAMVQITRGDAQKAGHVLLDVIAIMEDTGSKYIGQSLLEVATGLAVLRGEWLQSARFYAAAEAQTAETGIQRDAGDAAFLAPLVARARSALGPDAFAGAERAGRALLYDGAIAETRAWLTTMMR
jgi:predicted ATPase/class 3 adenylate cyclase